MIPKYQTSFGSLAAQADWMSTLILFLLLVVSITCISIILYKFFHIRRERKNLVKLLGKLRKAKTLQDIVLLSEEFRSSLGGRFLKHNLHELKHILEHTSSSELSGHDASYLELILSQSLEHMIMHEERYLPVLGTSAAVAPLAGLFGTVWGLVQAFISISHEQSADITVVAPGIAQALMTTLAGLIVAIPALIFFNYFTNEIRRLEHYLLSVSDTFFALAQKSFKRL